MTTTEWPAVDEPVERRNELRDVGEVQARRRLVEQEQRAAVPALRRSRRSASSAASFSRCASPPDSVGTGWPERQVLEPDVDERLQARAARRRAPAK